MISSRSVSTGRRFELNAEATRGLPPLFFRRAAWLVFLFSSSLACPPSHEATFNPSDSDFNETWHKWRGGGWI